MSLTKVKSTILLRLGSLVSSSLLKISLWWLTKNEPELFTQKETVTYDSSRRHETFTRAMCIFLSSSYTTWRHIWNKMCTSVLRVYESCTRACGWGFRNKTNPFNLTLIHTSHSHTLSHFARSFAYSGTSFAVCNIWVPQFWKPTRDAPRKHR